MSKEGHNDNTDTAIPLGLVRLRVGGEHHRCMADQPVTLVPVSDDGCGYPWWIGPTDITGLELEAGTAYVLDVAISSDRTSGSATDRSVNDRSVNDRSVNGLHYELVAVVETAAVSSSAIAS